MPHASSHQATVASSRSRFGDIDYDCDHAVGTASIAHWTKASGKTAYSPERSERCAALTSSAVFKTVTLLNEQAAMKPIAFALSQETKGCMSCHEKGGAVENIRTKMNCGECHEPEVKSHHGKI